MSPIRLSDFHSLSHWKFDSCHNFNHCPATADPKIGISVLELPLSIGLSIQLSSGHFSLDFPCVCVYVCAQSCQTLCDPLDCSPPASSVCGILQARILEWVAISSRGSSWPRDWTCISWVSCITGVFFTTEPSEWEATLLPLDFPQEYRIQYTPGKTHFFSLLLANLASTFLLKEPLSSCNTSVCPSI